MLGSQWQRCLFVALIPVVTACGSTLKSQTTPVSTASRAAALRAVLEPTAPAPVVQAAPVEDPVLTLIGTSDRHFKAGQKELEQGHVEAAKQEFNRAVDVLLESPYGPR